jgi:hypothetical protein
MPVAKYYDLILETLQGQTPEMRALPPERLDWDGPGAFLDLFDRTSGHDRTQLIEAIGLVLRRHNAPVAVLAQLVDIASSLDLAEVEPNVRRLQRLSVGRQEPLRSAITNYLAYRELTP